MRKGRVGSILEFPRGLEGLGCGPVVEKPVSVQESPLGEEGGLVVMTVGRWGGGFYKEKIVSRFSQPAHSRCLALDGAAVVRADSRRVRKDQKCRRMAIGGDMAMEMH